MNVVPSQFKDLLQQVLKYAPDSKKLLEKAFVYSSKIHKGQQRLSGDPFIVHPLAVAYILATLEQDIPTVAAGLLHDAVEDSGISHEDLKEEFGPEVAKLVEGVTKLGQLFFASREEREAENFRKMLLAMGEDLRIIIIKLADRLHNMQTLSFLPVAKQKETSLETREIFAPLAHRLGMWRLKWELEDLAFRYLEPDKFEEIKIKVVESRRQRETYITDFIAKIKGQLGKVNVQGEVYGRPKHFYSIYKKMVEQNLEFDDVYDLLAVRIIVGNVKDCYAVLGIIHAVWKPIPGRFRDYIAMPKSNGYQSLHTTVIGGGGRPIEVQIRTQEMHKVAEYGIAAHWRYKEKNTDQALDLKMSWLRQMLEWQKDLKDSKDFMESFKIDLFTDEVFVFTPKGAVFDLPLGATAVDFAYQVHTEVGHRCVGAKVNGRIVPLDHKLKNGDIVEIITGKINNPSLDWLNFTKTSSARTKIKSFLRRRKGPEKIEKIKKNGSLEEEFQLSQRARSRRQKKMQPIRVTGLDNVLVRFSKCCYPLPGDEIIGFVTKGKGVAIHRKHCPSVIKTQGQGERTVFVDWDLSQRNFYPVEIEIESFDRVGIFKDILGQVAETQTNVVEARVKTKRGSRAFIRLIADIADTRHLERVLKAIRSVSDVYGACRSDITRDKKKSVL